MSYRVHEKPHKHLARRTVEATATPMRVYVTNGSTADVAFPCFYQEVKPPKPAIHHDIHYHGIITVVRDHIHRLLSVICRIDFKALVLKKNCHCMIKIFRIFRK